MAEEKIYANLEIDDLVATSSVSKEKEKLDNVKKIIEQGSEQDIHTFLINDIKRKAKESNRVFDSPEFETKWAINKLDKLLSKEYGKGFAISCSVCKIQTSNAITGPLIKRQLDDNIKIYTHKNCIC